MIRRPPRSTPKPSSAASDVYKRQDQTHPFKPEEKIIEYRIAKEKNLTAMRIDDFADELSSESPAPGGGSVAALIGTLSASLSSMVANLTYNKKGYKEFNDEIAAAGIEAQKLKDRFLSLIEEDTEAFNSVMDAMKMPSGTDEEAEAKEKAIEEATKKATSVPLETLKLTEKLLEVANVVVEKGNKNSISDAGVAAISAKAAAESAYMNVIINVPGIKDEEFKENVLKEAKEVLENVRKKSDEIRDKVMKYLEENL